MVQLLSTVANPVRVVGRENLPDQIPNCGPLGGILTALNTSDLAMCRPKLSRRVKSGPWDSRILSSAISIHRKIGNSSKDNHCFANAMYGVESANASSSRATPGSRASSRRRS
jgi:hypothetical protein